MTFRTNRRLLFTVLSVLTLSFGADFAQTPAQLEIFEKNARPLFAQKCQGCHNARLKSGGFDLGSPEGLKEAAAMGIFGKAAEPEKSTILRALSYENQIKMPPQGKLPPETIAAVREWVIAGAPTPAATPSAGNSLAGTGVRPVALRGVITDAKNLTALTRFQHRVAALPGVKLVVGPGQVARRTKRLPELGSRALASNGNIGPTKQIGRLGRSAWLNSARPRERADQLIMNVESICRAPLQASLAPAHLD